MIKNPFDGLQRTLDPKYYLESFCRIKGKTGGIIPFKLNEAQKDIFNTVRKKNRTIILKARQIGFSTAITGLLYHKTITTNGINTAIIGYNQDLTKELLDKVKTFYRTTPDALKPTIHYNSKFEISFPKRDSKIIVLPSTENVGRGYTLHNVLCTELALWDKAEEKMVALENAVPLDGNIIIESTPHGIGNMFHRMWVSDNAYEKKEYGWWWHYSEKEIEIIRRRMNNPQLFAQEYELEFLSSGRLVFDVDSIRRQRRNILAVGAAVKLPDGKSFFVNTDEGVRVYRPPERTGMYVMGADVAEGVRGGDYSSFVIWDRKTGEEVAFYRGYISPDKFAVLLDRWGRRYFNALLVVEVNNHGIYTLGELKKLVYPMMYFRPTRYDMSGYETSERLGWRTTPITRPILIDDLAQAMRDKIITIHSKEILDEMSGFIYDDNNKMVAQGGLHDDTIFAAGIGYQGFKILYDKPLDQINYEKHLPTVTSY